MVRQKGAGMVEEVKVINCISEEERKQLVEQYRKDLAWARSLSEEQIHYLCDAGWYNNTIKGYLIAAARNAEFSDEDIRKLLNGLRWAFSEKNAEEAEKIYIDY